MAMRNRHTHEEESSYDAAEEAIRSAYGKMVDFDANKYLAMDIIESWETCNKVHPILDAMVSARLTPEEFHEALRIKLHTWLSHLIDHLEGLKTTLDALDKDEWVV